MKVLVSVIIPAYNVATCLAETIQSVLNQLYHNWEMIIVNDGSTDQTAEIAKQYAALDSRIRLIDQANQGVSIARNCGLALATGKYVSFLDADDLWHPSTLSSLVEKASDTGARVVYGKQNTLRLNGNIDIVYDDYPRGNILLKALQNSMIHIGGTLIEKSLLNEFNIKFTPRCALDEDTEFIWKVLTVTKAELTETVVLTRRDRIGSATNLKWSWKSASDSIASFERLTKFVGDNYFEADKIEVLSFLDYAVNFRRFKALWNLLKRRQYADVLSKLDDAEWAAGLAGVSKQRFSISQKIEYYICMTKSILLWKSIVRFLS